jgi:cysteine desulfurase
MLQLPIYLDNHATTRTDPRVVEAMLPYFTEFYGNAASASHVFGRSARKAVESARSSLAQSIGAGGPQEIIFTSGATEADNLAVKGIAEALSNRGNHLVTVQTEHPAILNACRHLEKTGFQTTFLSVDQDGHLDLEELKAAITDRTILVSVMAANSEIGTVHDIAAVGAICRERGTLFHTDATQAVGKIPFDVREMQVDLASFTAHKMYGSKGVGALYIRQNVSRLPLIPQMDGGGQEQGFRSGTLNVPGIVGFAKALEICLQEREAEGRRIGALRDRLYTGLKEALDGVTLNGCAVQRLPGNLNVSFDHIKNDTLLMNLRDLAVSGGSACATGSQTPSYVLKAIGASDDRAFSAVRFGVGRFNTAEEIEFAIQKVSETVTRLRSAQMQRA